MQPEYPVYIKEYFNMLGQWMVYFGMSSLDVEPNWLFDVCYKRDALQASKFGKVNTYCFVKYANEHFDTAKLQQFSSQSFDYAMKYRQGMPLGFGGSLGYTPVSLQIKLCKSILIFSIIISKSIFLLLNFLVYWIFQADPFIVTQKLLYGEHCIIMDLEEK